MRMEKGASFTAGPCFTLIVTRGDLSTGEDDVRDGLIILGVFLWLEKALDGDTVSLLEQVEVCGVLVAAPDLYIEDCAGALLVLILALSAGD